VSTRDNEKRLKNSEKYSIYSSSSTSSMGCPQQTSTPAPAITTLTAFPHILQT
jgi:hypothetical protein